MTEHQISVMSDLWTLAIAIKSCIKISFNLMIPWPVKFVKHVTKHTWQKLFKIFRHWELEARFIFQSKDKITKDWYFECELKYKIDILSETVGNI